MYFRCFGLALVAFTLSSCANSHVLSPVSVDFFVAAPRDNPWNDKIRNWQARHSLDEAVSSPPTDAPTSLAGEYQEFTNRVRRQVVSDTVDWVQDLSRRHYRPDGERDHWATLGEVIDSGGDDCDGLDLLTFVLLRRLGFAEDEIFRAIVVERGTGQHHMVTLWFDDDDRTNPLILDPTGVVTASVVRLSEVPDWSPIELFDERDHFAVTEVVVSSVGSSDR